MTVLDTLGSTTSDFIGTDGQWSTHNYHPLPVMIASGEGAWVTDVAGRRYLDLLAGYSALNFGHRHPALVAAAPPLVPKRAGPRRGRHHRRPRPLPGPVPQESAWIMLTEGSP